MTKHERFQYLPDGTKLKESFVLSIAPPGGLVEEALISWKAAVRDDRAFEQCPRCHVAAFMQNEKYGVRYTHGGTDFSGANVPWMTLRYSMVTGMELVCVGGCGYSVEVPKHCEEILVELVKAKGPYAVARALQIGMFQIAGGLLAIAEKIDKGNVIAAVGQLGSPTMSGLAFRSALGISNG